LINCRGDDYSFFALEATRPHWARLPDVQALAEATGFDVRQAKSNPSNGELLFEDVKERASEAMAFGRFRIMEVAMAEHYGVSRTIVRDILARLEEAGLVRKENRTHWVVGPLTADLLVQHYEIRMLTEPYLLHESIRNAPLGWVENALGRIMAAQEHFPTVSIAELDRIEDDLHNQLHQFQANNRLKAILSSHGMPSLIKRIFNRSLGPPSNTHALDEHEAILCDLCLHVLPPLFEQLLHERDARTTLCLLHDLRLGTPYVNIIANL
jgi:DNA-binding GntR family transcriptional regulator